MRIPFLKQVSWYLVFAMFFIGIVPKVEAGFVMSDPLAAAQVDRAQDLEKIQKILEMKMIRERLGALGLTADEINSKLAQLSDQQVHQFASKLDGLKVGGDTGGFIIGFLVVVILIIVILQLTGHRILVK